MRYPFAFVAALAWLIPAPTSAQIVTIDNHYAADGSVTNYPAGLAFIDVRRQQNVCIEWTFRHATGSSATDTNAIHFVPVVAGGIQSTTPKFSDGFLIVARANGATPVTIVTNFTVRGYSALEVYSITNNTLDAMTNRIRYSIKQNAP